MTLWMLATLLLSTLFALCAAIGERIAARFLGPRRFVWIAALIAGATLPVISGSSSTAFPPWRIPSRRESLWQDARTRSSAAPTRPTILERFDISLLKTSAARATSITRRADRWVLVAWLATSLALLIRLLARLVMLERERREWVVTTEFGDPLFVAANTGPAAVGVLRPRIVVPRWLLDEDPATRALLLRHESEHVRARDTHTLFGAALLEVLFPWNAALRWMASRLRLAIEIDCDQRVIRALGGARRYGLALLAASERYAAPVPTAACLQESPLQIEARIHAMTKRPASRRPLTGSLLLIALGGVVVTLSGWMPSPPLRSIEANTPRSVSSHEGPAERIVREWIAAFNDPDTTRIIDFVTVAFNHDRPSRQPWSSGGEPGSFLRWRRDGGNLVLRRIVAKSDWHAEYAATDVSTGREYVGYVMVSGYRPDWIEHFGVQSLPAGSALEDHEVQRQLYPDAAAGGIMRTGIEDLQHWLRGGFRP